MAQKHWKGTLSEDVTSLESLDVGDTDFLQSPVLKQKDYFGRELLVRNLGCLNALLAQNGLHIPTRWGPLCVI